MRRMRRVALVETVPDELHHHHGAEWFPFALGWLRERGVEAEWWALGFPRRGANAGARNVVDLPDGPRRILEALVGQFDPDTVIFHGRPVAEVRAAVSARAPGARIVDCTPPALGASSTVADLAALVGRAEPAPGGGDAALVLDAVAPCFERRVVDGRATCERQAARLAGELACGWRRLVREAEPYRELAEAGQYRGCAFCDRGAPAGVASGRPRTPPREIALRQIEAHQRDRAGEGAPFAYLLDDGRIAADLPGLLAAVLERGLRPSVFHAMPRVDELLAQHERLRAILPRAAAAGHRVSLLSTGVENFSPDENARLAKGIAPEQVWACWRVMKELEAAFPGAFTAEHEGFTAILFTPWTRPSDLRANVEAARRLGPSWLARVMGTRLQLFPGAPVTALARRDGLLSDAMGSAGDVAAVCLSDPDASEIAWRFADPRTERAHAILIRLDPIPTAAAVAEHPLTAEIRGLRAALPPALAGDYVALVAAVIDAVEALGSKVSAGEVFAWIARSPAAQAARAAPPALRSHEGEGTGTERGLRVAFADRVTGVPRYVFRVARATPGAPAFRVVGETRVTYDRCPRDAAFHACAEIVVAAARRIRAPPARPHLARWERLVRELVARSPVAASLEALVTASAEERAG
jgi:hypothetical protein